MDENGSQQLAGREVEPPALGVAHTEIDEERNARHRPSYFRHAAFGRCRDGERRREGRKEAAEGNPNRGEKRRHRRRKAMAKKKKKKTKTKTKTTKKTKKKGRIYKMLGGRIILINYLFIYPFIFIF
jgi:hypothetical protein